MFLVVPMVLRRIAAPKLLSGDQPQDRQDARPGLTVPLNFAGGRRRGDRVGLQSSVAAQFDNYSENRFGFMG